MDELKEIKLSYDLVFEALMREKNREELQKLEPTFYADVAEYIRQKFHRSRMEALSPEEREKASKQMQNIVKMSRDLYERRERKIANLALIKSRTRSIIDISTLLPEEQPFFTELVNAFNRYREQILLHSTAIPSVPPLRAETGGEPLAAEADEASRQARMIRFLHAVPKFIGKDLEIYGPFDEEDVATLPAEIAEVLIKKGRAEEIEIS